MSSIIKVGKVQSSTGNDAIDIANDGSISGLTTNNIQPASGQALTIKDEGGTASITVATNGEATFAENIILTTNKGLSFQNHSVSSATGASSTTSNNVLDDYEEGTWTPSFAGTWSSKPTNGSGFSHAGRYRKVGSIVIATFKLDFVQSGQTIAVDDRWSLGGLPFTGLGGGAASNGQNSGSVFFYASMGTGNNAMGHAFLDTAGTSLICYISHVDGSIHYGIEGGGTIVYLTS